MKKRISEILVFILLFITIVNPNILPSVFAENTDIPLVQSTVTSDVYDDIVSPDSLPVELDPEELITITTLTERFHVERDWVLQELLRGYLLHEIYQGLLHQESGGSYEEYMQSTYPGRVADPLYTSSITDDVYGVKTVTEDVYITKPSVTDDVYGLNSFLAASSKYDSVALERQNIKMNSAPYTVGSETDQISTLDGSLRVTATDLYLEGVNGLDFALTRIYDSSLSKDRMTVDTDRWENETKITKEERRFNIGQGWIWDIPYLKKEEGTQYIYLPNLGTYVLDIEEDDELVGYPWDNLDFGEVSESRLEELDEYFEVDDADYVLFDYTAGINTYFTSNGDVVLITNQYGNHIKFSWGADGLDSVFVYAGKDEMVSYLYTDFDDQSVEINAYNIAKGETQTVVYHKTVMEGDVRDHEVLSEVVDPVGRSTKYDYYIDWNFFNLISGYEYYTGTERMIYWGVNDWVELTAIEFPTKAMVQYAYAGLAARHIGEVAVQYEPVYKVRHLFYSTTEETEYSSMDVELEGDIGAVYGEDDTFSAIVDDGLTLTTYHYEKDFSGNRRPEVVYLTKTTVESLDKQMRQETNYTYDKTKYRAVPIQIQSRSYTGSSSSSAVTTKTSYNDWGLITSQTDPMGVTTTYEYDYYVNYNVRRWSPIKVTVPVSSTNSLITSYTYDDDTATLSQVQVKDSSGKLYGQTNYQYNTYGNPIEIRMKGDSSDTVVNQTFEYAPSKIQQSVSVTNAQGVKASIVQDASYDNRGNLLNYKDGNRYNTTVTYDAIGRPLTQTNPDGSKISSSYNDSTNTTVVTAPNGAKTTYEYDPFGRLTKQTDALGSITNTYDSFDRLIGQTDAEGNKSTFTYDAYGRILTENDGTSTTTYTYNDAARTKTIKDGVGNQIRETYDILGRVIKTEELKSTGNLTLSSSVYDNYGHLMSTTDAKGNKTTYAYDALSQLISVTDAEGKITSYSYNMAGDMI
ncbi:hypothetical protein V3851_17140, partial [Paenibacillus sp. M1]